MTDPELDSELDSDPEEEEEEEEKEEPEEDLLDRLGGAIADPDPAPEDDARQRLGGEAVLELGRLGELALWWAGVRATADAPVAGRVLLAGGSSDVAARRPGGQALALPRGGTVDTAMAWGVATADDAADRGVEVILLSLDDAEAARALTADLMGLDAVEATGWPMDRGLTDDDWMHRVSVLRDRLWRTRGLRGRPADLLRALASPATAAAAALVAQATARRTPVLLDGPGAAAAALLVQRTSYSAARWWQAAHLGTDPLHERALGSLGLVPLTRLGIQLEDGTAALAGLALLDLAAGMLSGPVLDD